MPMSMPPVTVVPGPAPVRQLLLEVAPDLHARLVQPALGDSTVFSVDEREVGLHDVRAVGRRRHGNDRLRLDAVGRIPAVHVVLQR